MRFKKHIKEEFGLKQLDIAPLIDVIFILLIFFMLTSNFMVQPGIRIDLPEVVSSQNLGQEKFTVIISSDDLMYLNNKLITDSELEKLIKDSKGRIKSIFIKSDKKSSMGKVVKIWDICKTSGIDYVNIATTNDKK